MVTIMVQPDYKKIADIKSTINADAAKLDEIVNDIIYPYTHDLDEYIDFVKGILKDGENPPTEQELDDFCMNISVFIYYASAMQERLGIKDDIARALYKEVYHSTRDKLNEGTIADKDSIAELASQQEALVSNLYKRAYSITKAKVAAAQEILSSCKKIMSRRISEMEITRVAKQ